MFLVLQFIDSYKKIHIVAGFVVLYNSSNLEVMDVLTSVVLSLPHCFNVTFLKINLAPFLQEEALNDNVTRNYILINFGY